MTDLKTILNALYRGAFPQANDEDINQKVQLHLDQPDSTNDLTSKLLSEPQAQEKNEQIEASPEEPKSDPFALNVPSANTVPSSFDVSSGMQPTTQKMEGQVGNVTPPPTPTSVNPEIPALENKMIPPLSPEASPSAASTPSKETPEPSTSGKNPLDVLTQGKGNADYEASQKFQDEERKKHMLGIIPTAMAGVGDAISNAASAFGAKGKTGATEAVLATLEHGEKLRKEQFDKKLLTDPNSDISQHYREILGMMMGKKADDPQITNLSADQIKQTMPEVEKFMAKELQLKAIAAQKQLSMSQQSGNERDRLWTQAIQSLNQLRGDKPLTDSETMRNGAISAYQAIDNIQKEGRAPNQFEYIDLLGQLWKARTGAVLSNEELKKMDVKTIQSKLGPIATYLTGDPKAVISPEGTQAIKNFAIQSGFTADQLHENYMQTRGLNAAASRMVPEDKERLSKMSRGLSFEEATGLKPEEWKKGAPSRTNKPGSELGGTSNLAPNEEVRQAKDGRKIVYDKTTKKPLRVYGQ